MSLSHVIDALLEEAVARGEFDNLPGKGQPLDLSAYFDTPEEVRLAYSILKNASILPSEAELLKEIAVLQEALNTSFDCSEQGRLRKAIQERLLKYRLLVDRRR